MRVEVMAMNGMGRIIASFARSLNAVFLKVGWAAEHAARRFSGQACGILCR